MASMSKSFLVNDTFSRYAAQVPSGKEDPSLKPMSSLRVCPPDAELDEQEQQLPPPPPSESSSVETLQPDLKRDPVIIRHQYLANLGIKTTAQSSRKRREIPQGLKVKLKAPAASSHENRSASFFKSLTEWYAGGGSSDESQEGKSGDEVADEGKTHLNGDDLNGEQQRSIRFKEEAEMFLIPVHHEYSQQQRGGMWHTRDEFISMVERNLGEVYEEMDRQHELEISRQQEEQNMMLMAEKNDTNSPKPSAPVPVIHVQPCKRVLASARARSPQEIRAKYLKHLGIPNQRQLENREESKVVA